MHRQASRVSATTACALLLTAGAAAGAAIHLDLQTRDRASGAVVTAQERIDPSKIGVVIVDMWNTNDCMTTAQRTAALVPRMNRVIEGARRLGMQIIWAPTDVAGQYAGMPQRERALALRHYALPQVVPFSCPFSVPTERPRKCMCGPGIVCHLHYGWDNMDPNLHLAASDWLVGDPEELYSIYKEKGLTRLIYMGIATNICVMNKPEGIKNMVSAGLKCTLARDLTDAETYYDPDQGFTPDVGTAKDVADVERSGVPTIDTAEEMCKAGVWDTQWVVEMVHLAPWGVKDWPYLFTDTVKVTLSTPRQNGVSIRYTLDGTEPGEQSRLYTGPLVLGKTTRLRTAAFEKGRRVSLPSEGYFVRMGALPAKPDVYLDRLPARKPARPEWQWEAKANQSYNGEPLSIRDQVYEKGMGMRAPANLAYEIQPDYDRFVARAGVDDELFRRHFKARFLATYPSVQFSVYIDGNLAAESPVMRIGQEPWRFDVKIPAGSRLIDLAVNDAGSRSPLDLADLVDAGFVRKK